MSSKLAQYRYIRIEGNRLYIESEEMLFAKRERKRASAILNALDGMEMLEARFLLEKCKLAMLQSSVFQAGQQKI